jgi:hypothetical protein
MATGCSHHAARPLAPPKPHVVFGSLEAADHVLAPRDWHINMAFVERINLTIRQHVAAVRRRVSTLCKGEDCLR